MKRSLGKLPVEFQKPPYCRERKSYSYPETFGKIIPSDNNNVFYINLAKVGVCKVRGWNKNLRFGENHSDNFLEYAAKHKRDRVTVKIVKDNCGDYWICFTLSDVYKPISTMSNRTIGVDVGVADIAILSDGTKYENKRFKHNEKERLAYLSAKQSKQQGWRNQKFVEAHRKDKELQISNGYKKTGLKIAKLNRKIARKRSDYNNNITTDIIKKNYFIGIESLDVKGLLEKEDDAKTNAQNARTHDNLADAAMGEVLSMLKYKAAWHNK
ncbi:MAG: transposase, partial [Bacteroidales bacterium]|nr:transposase [Bacteroidales bacterium]